MVVVQTLDSKKEAAKDIQVSLVLLLLLGFQNKAFGQLSRPTTRGLSIIPRPSWLSPLSHPFPLSVGASCDLLLNGTM